MNFRYKFSIVLVVLGLISAIMSFGGKKSSGISPEDILKALQMEESYISPDDLAKAIVDSDSAIQIIDSGNPDSYNAVSLPGAINIPLSKLLDQESQTLFEDKNTTTVFYSKDPLLATQSWMLAMQKGYGKVCLLKGGLEEWDKIVMKSEFSGEKITPQENVLFEKRYKARRIFTQWNAMPDSMKAGFFKEKMKKDKELVGGCE